MKNFVCQNGDFVLNPLWDAQVVKIGKGVGDVVCGSHIADEPGRHATAYIVPVAVLTFKVIQGQ